MSEDNKPQDKGRLWLFENTYKTNDNHPVLTGSGEISVDQLRILFKHVKDDPPEDGIVRLQCAAWDRVSKAGKPFKFVTFELKQIRENAEIPNPAPVKGHNEEEDIPF